MSYNAVVIIILIIVFGLFSCEKDIKKHNSPNLKLAGDFGIDSMQLVYQYYQKFGFTDLCEDLRMFSKPKVVPKLNKNLPIKAKDRIAINSFSNKKNTIGGSSIAFETNSRNEFYDIEIEYIEFSLDSTLTVFL